MLSKQLTSKLKEEQERENAQNPNSNSLNVAQADRLIRTVSCKVIFFRPLNFLTYLKS
jgi:hypothetical protein